MRHSPLAYHAIKAKAFVHISQPFIDVQKGTVVVSNLWDGALEAPRILIEARLKPMQGSRFQPTGFPSLGAAEFRGPDGTTNILLESAQSMANRLESVAWDDSADDLVAPLRGLPYVATVVGDRETDSIREAHRLNSSYLYPGIAERLQERAGVSGRKKKGAAGEKAESSGIDIRKFASAVFYFDPNSVLHGVFLEKLLGTARLTRVLSAFIEARDTSPAESGGVKNDRVDPVGAKFGGAAQGFGNVPFARTEYTAKEITAYFSIDTALLRSYGLGGDAEQLLVALALWKIQRFLAIGGRLRTACDLEPIGTDAVKVTRPQDWSIPSMADLEKLLKDAIQRCKAANLFADPSKTTVVFDAK
jgi:CRISPR-associated protein Csb1